MKEIILLKGIPASGKSKFARELLSKNPGKYKRINKDDLRAMLDDSAWSEKKEKFVLDVRDDLIIKSLNRGFNVVVDDTNFAEKHFMRMCEIAKMIGDVTVREKFINVELKEALQNNKGPNRVEVPDHVIIKMYNAHVKGRSVPQRIEYFGPKEKFKYNFDLKDALIFDIDGTLAVNNGSRGFFEWSKVGQDEVDENLKYIVESFHNVNILYKDNDELQFKIIIVSGRDEVCRKETEDWLQRNSIKFDALYMRPEGNKERDTIIKERIWREHLKDKFNIIAWFDDRKSVVDHMRSLGIKVLQIENHDF